MSCQSYVAHQTAGYQRRGSNAFYKLHNLVEGGSAIDGRGGRRKTVRHPRAGTIYSSDQKGATPLVFALKRPEE